MNKKINGFSKLFIVATVLVAFLVGGGLWFSVNQNYLLDGDSKNLKNEVAGWQVYTNDKYGFEIKYPSNYCQKIEDDYFVIKDCAIAEIQGHVPALVIKIIENTSISLCQYLADNSVSLTMFERPSADYLYYGIKDAQDLYIDNNPALRFYSETVSDSSVNNLVKVPGKNTVINIIKLNTGYGDFPADVFEKILSTFSFANKSSADFLQVATPVPYQKITSPVLVSGRSNFNEANTRIRIKDSNDKILADTFTVADGWLDKLYPFSKNIIYSFPSSAEGQVEVFEDNEEDGSEVNKVIVPVLFASSTDQNINIKLYFHNSGIKSFGFCNEVVPVVHKILKTEKIATATLEELLKGPTNEERADGYGTEIPAGSQLNSLLIINGEARADFNETIESGGGSCSMSGRVAQIRQTLLQFPTIKTVILSINGVTDPIFQP